MEVEKSATRHGLIGIVSESAARHKILLVLFSQSSKNTIYDKKRGNGGMFLGPFLHLHSNILCLWANWVCFEVHQIFTNNNTKFQWRVLRKETNYLSKCYEYVIKRRKLPETNTNKPDIEEATQWVVGRMTLLFDFEIFVWDISDVEWQCHPLNLLVMLRRKTSCDVKTRCSVIGKWAFFWIIHPKQHWGNLKL